MQLPKQNTDIIVDGENNRILFDTCYQVRRDFAGSLKAIIQAEGANCRLLPISGASAGAGCFQIQPATGLKVAGVRIAATSVPRVRRARSPDLRAVELDEIVIDADNARISAGAGITLEQLNQSLVIHLGPGYRVLGADLTSYTYAQVGASFMTGGMGPERRYFSDSVDAVLLFDGDAIRLLEGEAAQDMAGTYGWCGMVGAVRCHIVEVPPNEFGFAMPVNNTPEALAAVLQQLAPFAFADVRAGRLLNACGESNLIMGVEHLTRDAMAPLFEQGLDNEISRRARSVAGRAQAADADGVVFINGRSELDIDAFLEVVLVESGTDAGLSEAALEHSEVFSNPDLMRAVREAVPFAARMRAPSAKYDFKGHTDITVRLDPGAVATDMTRLWQANERYVDAVSHSIEESEAVQGVVLVYGHMNPYGVDPHNRITLASDNQEALCKARERIDADQQVFLRDINQLCLDSKSQLIGGEKGSVSELELFHAIGGVEAAPSHLREKAGRQRAAVEAASPLFNWRAMIQ